VHSKLELEAWVKMGRIVEEGKQFFMLKVERLSGHSALGVGASFLWVCLQLFSSLLIFFRCASVVVELLQSLNVISMKGTRWFWFC
jgi:hypothetical protein